MKTTSSFLEDNLFGRLRSRIIRISICTGKAIPVLNPLEDNLISTIPYLDVAYFVYPVAPRGPSTIDSWNRPGRLRRLREEALPIH